MFWLRIGAAARQSPRMRFFLVLLLLAYPLYAADQPRFQAGSPEQYDLITYSLGLIGCGGLGFVERKRNSSGRRWMLFASIAVLNAIMLAITLIG